MSKQVRQYQNTTDYRFAVKVVHALQTAGYIAYFAGGCVRDFVMGIEPHDFDVATSATPEQVESIFGARKTLHIGAAFGVACVHDRFEGQRCEVEVATFRTDGHYSDGRRPESVRYSSAPEDAQRRDFTINGLFYDPIAEQLHDFVEGLQDIELKRLRAIGDPAARFGEDKLRMLRAIRFAARFSLELAPATFHAIQVHASTIDVVSGERILVELEKTLTLPMRGWAWRRLVDAGLQPYILPALTTRYRDPSLVETDVALLEAILPEHLQFTTSMAAILLGAYRQAMDTVAAEDNGNQWTSRWLSHLKERLHVSNDQFDAIAFALSCGVKLTEADRMPWSVLQPLLIERWIEPALGLSEAIVRTSNKDRKGLERCRTALLLPANELDPPPLLTGYDLKKLGQTPGPHFAQWLKEIRANQLDGKLVSSDDAVRWVRERIASSR